MKRNLRILVQAAGGRTFVLLSLAMWGHIGLSVAALYLGSFSHMWTVIGLISLGGLWILRNTNIDRVTAGPVELDLGEKRSATTHMSFSGKADETLEGPLDQLLAEQSLVDSDAWEEDER